MFMRVLLCISSYLIIYHQLVSVRFAGSTASAVSAHFVPEKMERLDALRGHFGNELRASDGALASSQAELAATRSLLADAQGQLRHNSQQERRDLAHLRQASYDSQARADWRQPSHAGSATAPIAVGLLLQEVRELERCSFRSPQSRA
jgi:hypothetical protein